MVMTTLEVVKSNEFIKTPRFSTLFLMVIVTDAFY